MPAERQRGRRRGWNHLQRGHIAYPLPRRAGCPTRATPNSDPPTHQEAGAGAPAPTYCPPCEWRAIFHMPQAYFISGAARYFILGQSPNISLRLRPGFFRQPERKCRLETRKNPAIASRGSRPRRRVDKGGFSRYNKDIKEGHC